MLTQTRHQQIDIPLDERLLLAHRPVAEAMGELPPELPMQLAVRRDEVLRHVLGGLVEVGPLAVLLALGVVPGDLAPGAGVGVGELVGRDAHHGAVALEHGVHVEGDGAADVARAEGEPRGAPEERAWVVSQRVEEDIVEEAAYVADQTRLSMIALVSRFSCLM